MKTYYNDDIPTRDEFALWLNNHNLNGEGVEIGVCEGVFAEHNLNLWKCSKYHMVDPWKRCDGYDDCPDLNDKIFEEYYQALLKKYKNNNQVNIIRKTSIDAVNDFKDESFDWIYIDAFHTYEHVKQDINLWYPKVKKGGLFSGHDYTSWPGVAQAVDEFFKNIEILNLTPNNPTHWSASWWIIKE